MLRMLFFAPLRWPVVCRRNPTAAALSTASNPSNNHIALLRQYILEYCSQKPEAASKLSDDPASSVRIHIKSLTGFYAKYPSTRGSFDRKRVEQTDAGQAVRWVCEGRGKSYIEVQTAHTSSEGEGNINTHVEGWQNCRSVRDIRFPALPSAAEIQLLLSNLRQHMLKRYAYSDPMLMNADNVPGFVPEMDKVKYKLLMNRKLITAHGAALGLRWTHCGKKNYIEALPTSDNMDKSSVILSSDNTTSVEDAIDTAVRPQIVSDLRRSVFMKGSVSMDDLSVFCLSMTDFSKFNQHSREHTAAVDVLSRQGYLGGETDGVKVNGNTVIAKGNLRRDNVLSLIRIFIQNKRNQKKLRIDACVVPSFISREDMAEYKAMINKQCIETHGSQYELAWFTDPTSHHQFIELVPAIDMSTHEGAVSNAANSLQVCSMSKQVEVEDLHKLATILPIHIRNAFIGSNSFQDCVELVLDVGRLPTLRYFHKIYANNPSDAGAVYSTELDCTEVTMEEIKHICDNKSLGKFNSSNRAGMETTLHRISRKLNRHNDVIGLTMRVGRMIEGSTNLISDIVKSRKSVLLLGNPGVGKTSVLREYARLLSEAGKRVEIIDTSNEIAGDGNVPHHSVGRARRMMVNDRSQQHEVMREAVQNHMPQCVIVDEIGSAVEAQAAADIAQRGVQLIATAHGTSIQHLLNSPQLNRLVGGVHSVVVGDDHMKRRSLHSKSIQERKGQPVFEVLVEMRSLTHWNVYHNIATAVDGILANRDTVEYEKRTIDPTTKNISIIKRFLRFHQQP